MTLIADASLEVVYQDKSLFKAKVQFGIKKTETPIAFPRGCVPWIQMRVGLSASTMAGFMAMDCISPFLQRDCL